MSEMLTGKQKLAYTGVINVASNSLPSVKVLPFADLCGNFTKLKLLNLM